MLTQKSDPLMAQIETRIDCDNLILSFPGLENLKVRLVIVSSRLQKLESIMAKIGTKIISDQLIFFLLQSIEPPGLTIVMFTS